MCKHYSCLMANLGLNRFNLLQASRFMRPIDLIKEQINHSCDGPITPFVLISQAIYIWLMVILANMQKTLLMP